jgi:putative transposase
MKRRNPRWGCPRIAHQIALAFGVQIDKNVDRRILCVHYRPESDSGGPSWLTFPGQTKDSLWSCDFIPLRIGHPENTLGSVVMDQFTRRVIGFGIHGGIVDGGALCRISHRAIRGHSRPKYLSSDHDRFIGSTNRKLICGCSTWRRSRLFLTCLEVGRIGMRDAD